MASFFSSAGSFLITVLASVFVFGIVIFIHELGHFLTAKFSGIQVNEFALGMGPTPVSYTHLKTIECCLPKTSVRIYCIRADVLCKRLCGRRKM